MTSSREPATTVITPRDTAYPARAADGDRAWYVVTVKLRRERFAATELRRRDVDVFLPRLLVRRGPTEIVRPLFPGYVFARLALPREWARVVWAPGVDGAVVVSQRGGDFLFEVGEDLAIGYESHDAEAVALYLVESFTFRVATPEAAVALSG